MEDLKIEVSQRGEVSVLEIEGELRLGQPTTVLRAEVSGLVASGKRRFVFDMLNVPWLDSSGIGEVFACYKRARQHDGQVKLVLTGKSRSIFTFTQLNRIFDIYSDTDEAVASFEP